MSKKKLKKYIVNIEFIDSYDFEVKAKSKKEALEKAYEEGCIDGHIISESVELINEK